MENSINNGNEYQKVAKNIRPYIQKIEEMKDSYIQFLDTYSEFDKNVKLMWISDIKEFYYLLFTIFQILLKKKEINQKTFQTTYSMYINAQSKYAQVISELKEFKEEKTIETKQQMEEN
ncbi:MAG: hypothetical protein EU550_00770, partial [Promethearchaeota archaeon]